ncbi:hypothetical protein VTK56DRAFT_570 [Thermocarpiscus australiensis]
MTIDIRPDQEEALLRVAAYHRHDFDLMVIRSPPSQHDPVRSSIAQAFPDSPAASLGILSRLPTEILFSTLKYLDVLSCFRFRQVNRQARVALSALWEYRDIATHALEVLRSVLRTGLATRFTLSDLHRPLCTMKCRRCGAFGVFLFLPTAQRCCYNCVVMSIRFHVDTLSALAMVRTSPKTSLAELRRVLPVMRAIPGVYGIEEKALGKTTEVVAMKHAFRTLSKLGFELKDDPYLTRIRPPRSVLEKSGMKYWALTALPYLDRASGEVQHGLCCKGCHVAFEASAAAFRRHNRTYSKVSQITFNHAPRLSDFGVPVARERSPLTSPK